MKALVTGATGFVGAHLAEALVHRGIEVTALVRSPAKAARLTELGIKQVPGDLQDLGALGRAVEGQDVIFHVAGVVAARDEAGFLRGNREGTANLLAAAHAAGRARFILVSSMAAAGPSALGRPLRGSEPPAPVTSYGRSKLASERLVMEGSLPWTILRPPMVYGPGDREVLKVFQISRAGIVPVFGSGGQELSAVYAADLAEALIATAESDRAAGRVYYACHPEVFTSRSFVEEVGRVVAPGRETPVRVLPLPRWLARGVLTVTGATAAMAGRTTILTPDKANEFFQPAWTGDPSPLTQDTGWRPAHDLATGLGKTAAWYRDQGWL